MAKRVKVYFEGKGDPIEINQEDLDSFEAKGWRTDSPRSSKTKAAPAAKSQTLKNED